MGIQSKNCNLSIMMIDIDDFKKFNDSRGHIHGDIALKEISRILKENCRKMDIICRYGGEEFAVILPHTNKQDALFLAERIRKSVQEQEILKNRFTISIGIASAPRDVTEKESLVKKADEALYEAKRSGKNRVVLI